MKLTFELRVVLPKLISSVPTCNFLSIVNIIFSPKFYRVPENDSPPGRNHIVHQTTSNASVSATMTARTSAVAAAIIMIRSTCVPSGASDSSVKIVNTENGKKGAMTNLGAG